MLKFVTCGQMKILERRANQAGLSYYQMMENAGTAAAEIICEKMPSSLAGMKVLLFCGKGNNGGDGFVVARKLMEQGAAITLALVDGRPVTKDAVTNFDLVKQKSQIIDMTKTDMPFVDVNGRQDLMVDAIYGTGFHGQLNCRAIRAASFINQFKGKIQIASLDIPSGLGGDAVRKSQVDLNAVRADYTITFHNKKPIHLQRFAKEYCGELFIVDIGIDEETLW
ncbi:MAG: NAD(P)H-hydrate epimerase [Firmicutes bacterium]|jgi:NAD(P)H-hydrate epimerase|nr:NAD(P)H-hydrate epimerase [Bacillota bacterium]NBI62719.1 NAD(P)H-hydrate epimerase [Clostridiales bacterium]